MFQLTNKNKNTILRLKSFPIWIYGQVLTFSYMCLTAKNLTLMYANNKGTDQPVHLHSLIRTLDIHTLKV